MTPTRSRVLVFALLIAAAGILYGVLSGHAR
jgi:hypothetical protein